MLPTPVSLVALGSLWYGELCCGLYRALAAPWLDPWWLARETRIERLRAPEAAAIAARPQQRSSPPATAPSGDRAIGQATIISWDRARARAAARRAAATGVARR
jgi:hypothetical protein